MDTVDQHDDLITERSTCWIEKMAFGIDQLRVCQEKFQKKRPKEIMKTKAVILVINDVVW